jgi:hypothetical protein
MFLENCVLRGISKDVLKDLMTIRGTHRYKQEAIVWNYRTSRFEWNPFGRDNYHASAKINTETDARLLYERAGTARHRGDNRPPQSKGRDYENYSNDPDWSSKGKNWHRPSSVSLKMRREIKSTLLSKSSVMGMKGEYSPDFLDQVLQHACLIPYIGGKIQDMILDAFALNKSSNELDEFCRIPIHELKEWGITHFPAISEYHKDGFCKTDKMVVALLNDRLTSVSRFANETGFETVSDILVRLHKRLTLIIPFEKGIEDIYFDGPGRVPRKLTSKEKAEQLEKCSPWAVPKKPLKLQSSSTPEPKYGQARSARKGKGEGKTPSKGKPYGDGRAPGKGKPTSPVKGKNGKGKGPPYKGHSSRQGKGTPHSGAHPGH